MNVKDVMTEKIVTCKPETNLAEVASLFWQCDCGAIPVADENGKLVGMLTDRHVCIALGTRDAKPSDLTAADVMEPSVVTCNASDHIRAAVHIMREAHVRRLPVLDDNLGLVGIISIDDILMNVQRDYGNVGAISYAEMLKSLQKIIERADRQEMSQAAAA